MEHVLRKFLGIWILKYESKWWWGVGEGRRRGKKVLPFFEDADAMIDEIIDFAEIREFIDMPVQSYSSGMQVRLGFAVATKLAFGFLVVNEVVLA